MTPANFTLPTPGANPLAVLPPRRRTGARVEPGGGGRKYEGRAAKIWTPEGPGTQNPILSESFIALRTAGLRIRRSTYLSRYQKKVRSLFVLLVGLSQRGL